MMDVVNSIVVIMLVIALIMSLVSIIFPRKTLKWAKTDRQTRIHGFLFYILLSFFLFFTFGIGIDHSLSIIYIWLILLALTLIYIKLLYSQKINNKIIKDTLDNQNTKYEITSGINDDSNKLEEPKNENIIDDFNILKIAENLDSRTQRARTIRAFFANTVHEDEDQQLRQRNARFCKIISIDKNNMVGIFKGSAKEPYTTTPESCTCHDFILRRHACKHMYRLMHELGLFDLTKTNEGRVSEFRYDLSAFDESQIEKLSEAAQKELLGLVREWISSNYPNEWLYERKNSYIKELITNGFLEEINDPYFLLSHFHIKQLRMFIKDDKTINKQKKENIINGIIQSRPDVIKFQQEFYITVDFCEYHLPFRGKIRNYLRRKFPEEIDYLYEFSTSNITSIPLNTH